MSLNDTPEVREIYKGFKIESVACRYTMAGADKGKRAKKILTRNF